MKSIHADAVSTLQPEPAVRNDVAGRRLRGRMRLIVVWLAVLLPLAYGVYEEVRQIMPLFD